MPALDLALLHGLIQQVHYTSADAISHTYLFHSRASASLGWRVLLLERFEQHASSTGQAVNAGDRSAEAAALATRSTWRGWEGGWSAGQELLTMMSTLIADRDESAFCQRMIKCISSGEIHVEGVKTGLEEVIVLKIGSTRAGYDPFSINLQSKGEASDGLAADLLNEFFLNAKDHPHQFGPSSNSRGSGPDYQKLLAAEKAAHEVTKDRLKWAQKDLEDKEKSTYGSSQISAPPTPQKRTGSNMANPHQKQPRFLVGPIFSGSDSSGDDSDDSMAGHSKGPKNLASLTQQSRKALIQPLGPTKSTQHKAAPTSSLHSLTGREASTSRSPQHAPSTESFFVQSLQAMQSSQLSQSQPPPYNRVKKAVSRPTLKSSGKSLACVFSGGESSDGDFRSKSAYPSEIASSSGPLAALKKETASEVKSGSETEPE